MLWVLWQLQDRRPTPCLEWEIPGTSLLDVPGNTSTNILPPFGKESPHEWDVHTFPSQGVTFFNIFYQEISPLSPVLDQFQFQQSKRFCSFLQDAWKLRSEILRRVEKKVKDYPC